MNDRCQEIINLHCVGEKQYVDEYLPMDLINALAENPSYVPPPAFTLRLLLEVMDNRKNKEYCKFTTTEIKQ